MDDGTAAAWNKSRLPRYGHLRHTEKPYANGRLLEGADLYLALDRSDLAEAYRKRQQTKTALEVATGISLLSSVIAAAVAKAGQTSGHPAPTGPLVGLGMSIMLTGPFAIANASTPGDVRPPKSSTG